MALTDKLTAIANAIRGKTGKTESLTLDQMATEIEGISGDSGYAVVNIEDEIPTQFGDRLSYFESISLEFPYVRVVGEQAFNLCKSIRIVKLPICDSIAHAAFYGCDKLLEIDMRNVTSIGTSAFCDCSVLKEIDIPSITSIPYNAFGYCKNVASVNFPNVTDVGNSAFTWCTALNEVYLPKAVSIDEDAFFGCTALHKIDLPKVTSIGKYAFAECTNLEAVILRTTEAVCVSYTNSFTNTPLFTGTGHIYVPDAMYESYRAGYEATINEMMPGFFDILFRKIEDYPEICG